jgi:predicted ferric reductase
MVHNTVADDENDFYHESIEQSLDNEVEPEEEHKQKEQNNHRTIHIPSNQYDYHSYYKTSMNEASLFYMIFSYMCSCCFSNVITRIYQIRWILSYPYRARIIPQWMFTSPTNKNNKHSNSRKEKNFLFGFWHNTTSCVLYTTVGEICLFVPTFLCFIEGYYATFISPSIAITGNMATYLLCLTFLSANKTNSLFAFLFGIPFERLITYHYICAILTVIVSTFHAYVLSLTHDITPFFKFLTNDRPSTSGTIATTFMLLTICMSFHSTFLRKFAFQLWLYCHIILAIGVLGTLFIHGAPLIISIGLWWLLDVFVRYGIMASCKYRIPSDSVRIRRITIRNNTHEPAVEISFPKPKGFDYNPGQFVQIAIPAISVFEFHPVSISSSPNESQVTMHLRQRGDWTGKLASMSETLSSKSILMEGPYGSLSVDVNDVNRYRMVLLICGGIGVTPCQAIGKTILYQHMNAIDKTNQYRRPLKLLKMVWAVRDMNIVNDIPPLGGIDVLQHVPNVDVDIYCTRVKNTSDEIPFDEMDVESNISSPYNVTYGQRPNIDNLFICMKEKALQFGEHNIAVIGCGPTELMEDVKVACRKYSDQYLSVGSAGSKNKHSVHFDLHMEKFEF